MDWGKGRQGLQDISNFWVFVVIVTLTNPDFRHWAIVDLIGKADLHTRNDLFPRHTRSRV
jgi:hypothetical protein